MILKNFIKGLMTAVLIVFMLSSCNKDDDFLEISALEHQIFTRINNHRNTAQLNKLVFQPIIFNEAKLHSKKMGDHGSVTDEGLDEIFNKLYSRIGGTTSGYIIFNSRYAVADSIMKEIQLNPETNSITLSVFTQAGVGVFSDNLNNNYVTILFLNIPD